jgi:threonine aldolase
MAGMTRREFVKSGTFSVAAVAGGGLGTTWPPDNSAPEGAVKLYGDGLSLTPRETTELLQSITEQREIKSDYYSNGGAVEEMERAFAAVLGKERAVFMPTGTLANHLALRLLAGERRRCIVQQLSHVYNDSGDCCQTLSNLNLIPLVPGGTTFTAAQVREVLDMTAAGRVKTGVGALLVETPVRRANGGTFNYDELRAVCALARERGIGTHLDGARIFLQSAYTGIPPAEYASHFDTVYVSLYKYFNAPSGAVLAGPAALLDEIYHTRRMFGGGMPAVWPFAVIAHHFLAGFLERYGKAVAASERFISLVQQQGFAVRRVPAGTNIFMLRAEGMNPEQLRQRLAAENIGLHSAAPETGEFKLLVNETWNRIEPEELADRFIRAGKR